MPGTGSDPHSNYDPVKLEKSLGPLGLLPGFEAGADAKRGLESLEKFSLEREVRRLREDKDFLLEDRMVPTLAREFKRFMSLGLLFPQPKYSFAPSRIVDRIWHELILDTQRYQTMCLESYGALVHHDPLDPGQIASYAGEVIAHTKQSLVMAYGALTPSMWGSAESGCDYQVCWY